MGDSGILFPKFPERADCCQGCPGLISRKWLRADGRDWICFQGRNPLPRGWHGLSLLADTETGQAELQHERPAWPLWPCSRQNWQDSRGDPQPCSVAPAARVRVLPQEPIKEDGLVTNQVNEGSMWASPTP